MTTRIQAIDLGFFSTLASVGSLGAAARELGVTTAAVSKRLAQMEARLGISLVVRTTRRMSLTPEGELYLKHARRILGEIEDIEEMLGVSLEIPQGFLRVNATLGFGRRHVAPPTIMSGFSSRYTSKRCSVRESRCNSSLTMRVPWANGPVLHGRTARAPYRGYRRRSQPL